MLNDFSNISVHFLTSFVTQKFCHVIIHSKIIIYFEFELMGFIVQHFQKKSAHNLSLCESFQLVLVGRKHFIIYFKCECSKLVLLINHFLINFD